MPILKINKLDFLTPLTLVAGVVDRKQAKPVLSNVRLAWDRLTLTITCSDLEIQTTAKLACEADEPGAITVGAKKILEIIRCLDDESQIQLCMDAETLRIKQGRSSFKLTTLPAIDFPMRQQVDGGELRYVQRTPLLRALQATVFAIALQDVRAFLNGLLVSIESGFLVMIGMDGHRMAILRMPMQESFSERRLILPRKSVNDLLRLLQQVEDEEVRITLFPDHFVLTTSQYHWDSKLIDAPFPAYQRAIPTAQNCFVYVDKEQLRKALSRTMILANERLKAVVLSWQAAELHLVAYNQEHEEAVEMVTADIQGESMKIAVNANYLLDVLAYLPDGQVELSFNNPDSSILVQSTKDKYYQYLIMPMKL